MDRETVIKALECCEQKVCMYESTMKSCPYIQLCGDYEEAFYDCTTALAKDVLTVLEVKPRLMTYIEALSATACCLEDKDRDIEWPVSLQEGWGYTDVYEMGLEQSFRRNKNEYGKTWRCWNKEPTKEQAKAAKWEK